MLNDPGLIHSLKITIVVVLLYLFFMPMDMGMGLGWIEPKFITLIKWIRSTLRRKR